jgi:DNA/RNA endonuclease G (NUC1)
VPQEGIGFNTGVWSGFERLVRTLAEQRSPLFVITGPVYQQRKAIKGHAEVRRMQERDYARAVG